MTESTANAPGPGAGRRRLALVVVLVAGFMDLLDVNIVNVALPSLQRDLGVDYAADQMVTAACTLAFGVVLFTALGTQTQQATDQAVPAVSQQLTAAGVAPAEQSHERALLNRAPRQMHAVPGRLRRRPIPRGRRQ